MRRFFLLLLLAGVAAAKPPFVPGYARMDDLERGLQDLFAELKAKEEFEAKPFPERLLIMFQRNAPSYEHVRKLTGEAVVEAIFEEWEEAQAEQASEAVQRVLAALPEVLKQKYNVMPIPKQERYKASKPLVEALTHERLHMRQAAIDCLRAIYGEARLYQATLPAKQRIKRKKEWLEYIKKKARR